MSFDLDDYEPVAVRLDRWWADHPEGRVLTKLVHADGESVCVRVEVYRDADDERPYATGYAEERRDQGPVNRTSALENAETSAVGRALAQAGYAGSDPAKRPSREEMRKVANHGQGPAPMPSAAGAVPEGDPPLDAWRDVIVNLDGWYDNRADKKNVKAPDFKAKPGNPHWGQAGEPWQGKPQPLALWLRDAPPNFKEALAAGDVTLLARDDEMPSARGVTVEEAVAALGTEIVEQYETGEEPFEESF